MNYLALDIIAILSKIPLIDASISQSNFVLQKEDDVET
jgi:hypothetical protein